MTAYAAVSTEDLYFDLDDTNNRTSVSIIDQIYNAVYDASAGYPDYVVFDKHPSTKVGTLDCVEGREYSFDEDASRYLGDLRFVPSEDTTGSYTINFTAYDTKNKSYFGTLTITVERTLGDMDIYYTATKGDIVDFDAEDFSNFWLDTYGNGYLISVSFPELPAASSGVLYFGYTSSSRPGTKVRTDDTFYYEPGKNEDEIDLTFVPAGKFTGYVTLPFEAYGKNNKNSSSYMDGTMYIFVSDGSVEDVSVTCVVMNDVLCPLVIHLMYLCGKDGKAPIVSDPNPQIVDESTPHVRRIRMADIVVTNAKAAAGCLCGLPEAPLEDISIVNTQIHLVEAQPQVPVMNAVARPVTLAGLTAEHVRGLHMTDVRIVGAQGEAFALRDVE